jgi:hypothetical protein
MEYFFWYHLFLLVANAVLVIYQLWKIKQIPLQETNDTKKKKVSNVG